MRLAWNASPDSSVAGYRVYWGAASTNYTNSLNAGTNLTATVTNLVRGTKYYFAATAYASNGVESSFSNEAAWPQPFTNYVTLTVTRRSTLAATGTVVWSLVVTNPPGDQAFFETLITQTNDAVKVLRINTSTLLIANTNQP